MKKTVLIGLSALVLAACQTASPLQSALSGNTLVNPTTQIMLNEDGTMSGGITGTWETRGNQFCRTITEPARLAGTACQDAELGDGTVTLTRANGTQVVWAIE